MWIKFLIDGGCYCFDSGLDLGQLLLVELSWMKLNGSTNIRCGFGWDG